MMKKCMILAAFIGCLLAAMTVQAQVTPDAAGYIVKVGDTAPDFEMTLTDGQQVKLSSLRGKVVMLQFTASWLVRGMPQRDAVHRAGYLAET